MSQLHFCEIEVGNQEHRLLWPLYIIVLVRLEHNKGRWRLGIWHGSNDARSWTCNQSISEGRKIQEGCLRGWGYGSEILVLRWWWWKWKGWLVRSVCEREEVLRGWMTAGHPCSEKWKETSVTEVACNSVFVLMPWDVQYGSVWNEVLTGWFLFLTWSILFIKYIWISVVYVLHETISEYSKKPQALQPIQCLFQYFSISKAWEKTSYKALRKIYFQSCADSCEKTLYLTRTEMHFTGGKFSHPSEYRFLKNNQHSRTKKWGLEVLFMEGTRN